MDAQQHSVPTNRQAQDVLWLGRLTQQGLVALLPNPVPHPEAFERAVHQFNAGSFWKSHETLEEAWQAVGYPQRLFYYALIKTAVGFVHTGRHNERSAISQFQSAEAYLKPFLPVFLGVQVEPIRQTVTQWLAELRGTAPLAWERLDRIARPTLHVASSRH